MNKIILVTGATDGIGKITVTELAKKENHVIIHGRNEQKAQKIVAEIKQQVPNAEVKYLIADLFSL